jgi:hypothetical protein
MSVWVRINVQFCAHTPRTKPPGKSASGDDFWFAEDSRRTQIRTCSAYKHKRTR